MHINDEILLPLIFCWKVHSWAILHHEHHEWRCTVNYLQKMVKVCMYSIIIPVQKWLYIKWLWSLMLQELRLFSLKWFKKKRIFETLYFAFLWNEIITKICKILFQNAREFWYWLSESITVDKYPVIHKPIWSFLFLCLV